MSYFWGKYSGRTRYGDKAPRTLVLFPLTRKTRLKLTWVEAGERHYRFSVTHHFRFAKRRRVSSYRSPFHQRLLRRVYPKRYLPR